jgi:hypothetical protein
LKTPNNASVVDSKDLRHFSDNMSNLNQDIIKDYKNKVSKLSSELNNRDQECLKLKEQIIFLQKENMELKLNSRSASHVGSYSMLNS